MISKREERCSNTATPGFAPQTAGMACAVMVCGVSHAEEAQYAMSKSLPVAIADPEEYVAIFIAGSPSLLS